MNARQKAKKYKRLYESLVTQKPPIVFEEPHHIDTLKFVKCYPEDLINTHYIQMDITQGIIKGLDKYIVYWMDFDPTMNVWRVCGELKVVDR